MNLDQIADLIQHDDTAEGRGDLFLIIAGDADTDVQSEVGQAIMPWVRKLTPAERWELCAAFDVCPVHVCDVDNCRGDDEPCPIDHGRTAPPTYLVAEWEQCCDCPTYPPHEHIAACQTWYLNATGQSEDPEVMDATWRAHVETIARAVIAFGVTGFDGRYFTATDAGPVDLDALVTVVRATIPDDDQPQ
ncbi:hypothetical protein [Actinokineospora terrae]|uniref:Uncharacterized protein n=1 Tax=Actinokineospora terrae TaxID=155974 RepID=A0A1H9M8Y8_9PSEU|nr:hypothetical protein [Actinokineospora terrae]SER19897.1 hypothetical protein SAMN04487818_10218 [Actinokineospora terrae]